MAELKRGDRVEIVEMIEGDYTPTGTRGTVARVAIDGYITITLDGEWGGEGENQYFTDGGNLRRIQ